MSQTTTPAVRGVPAFFVRSWLTNAPTLLWVILGALGAIDLLLSLANFAMGDFLGGLVNLVLGVVEVAAAAFLVGVLELSNKMMHHLSAACMVAMWLTAAWSVITFFGVFGTQGIFAVLGLVFTVAFMMVVGSASAVIKSCAM